MTGFGANPLKFTLIGCHLPHVPQEDAGHVAVEHFLNTRVSLLALGRSYFVSATFCAASMSAIAVACVIVAVRRDVGAREVRRVVRIDSGIPAGETQVELSALQDTAFSRRREKHVAGDSI